MQSHDTDSAVWQVLEGSWHPGLPARGTISSVWGHRESDREKATSLLPHPLPARHARCSWPPRLPEEFSKASAPEPGQAAGAGPARPAARGLCPGRMRENRDKASRDTERSTAQPASWEDVPKTAEPRERQGRHGLFPSLPRTGRSKHVCETSRPGMKPAPRGAEGGAVGLGGQGRGTGQASPTAGHGSLGLSLFGRDATSPGTRPASEAFPTAAGLTTPTVLGTART